jgi:hypothetical protein
MLARGWGGVLLLAVLPALWPPGGLAGQGAPVGRLRASLERVYGRGISADTLVLDETAVLRVERADSQLGFARVLNVRGKDQPITLLVATDTALLLRDIDVLVYREAYGGEVAYDSWRRQFRGRGPADSLVVGREIRGIAGATISVNAVTLGVRRALADFRRWRGEGRL